MTTFDVQMEVVEDIPPAAPRPTRTSQWMARAETARAVAGQEGPSVLRFGPFRSAQSRKAMIEALAPAPGFYTVAFRREASEGGGKAQTWCYLRYDGEAAGDDSLPKQYVEAAS